ncbi:hypothetical protein Tco_0362766 [Tanacetum coccineum]
MAFLFLGPNRLASPRVNGYLVKASSNPFTFYDSPLPGVNTPWDVMRIVCNPELMDVAEVVQIPTGRYVVPTGRVIATVSIKVPTGRVRMDMGDKEVTKQDLVAKVVMEVLSRLLGDMVVMPWRCLRS